MCCQKTEKNEQKNKIKKTFGLRGGKKPKKNARSKKKSFIGHPTCAQQNNNFLGGVWGEMVAMGSNEMGNEVKKKNPTTDENANRSK